MSDESWTQYRPKLAIYDILDKPGGVSVDVAMKRADAALENHREQANRALILTLQKLDALAAAKTENPDQFYELSTFVLDVAGIFQPPLCRAANSLCDLIVRMKAAGRWDWPTIHVHLSSMKLLAGKQDDKDPAVQTVLTGLGAVVGRYADPSPPDPPKPNTGPNAQPKAA